MFVLQATLLLGTTTCAPPLLPDPTEPPETLIESMTITSSVNQTSQSATTVFPSMDKIPLQVKKDVKFSANERKDLISHLINYDLSKVDPLLLNPNQRAAILQELEHQQLGLPPFTDPTPWQKLTRDQQIEFNRKYLSLRKDLQEYSRNQFLSLPVERQEHAYNAFLSVDIKTLSKAIAQELERERRVLNQNKIEEQQLRLDNQLQQEEERIKSNDKEKHVQVEKLEQQDRNVPHKSISKNDPKIQQQQTTEAQIFAEQRKLYEEQVSLQEGNLRAQQQDSPSVKLLEQQRQNIINKLFDVVLSKKSKSNPDKPKFEAQGELNVMSQAPPYETPRTKLYLSSLHPIQNSIDIRENSLTLPSKKRRFFSSTKEVTREQRRQNLRRLNFDPRRKQG